MGETTHRRYNPLLGEWVLVSPHRLARPWLGRVEPTHTEARRAYDPDCYLCPGNIRAGTARNPPYTETFVFDNDYPALTLAMPEAVPSPSQSPLLVAAPERGVCRVVCFSPRHDLSLPQLATEDVRRVVDVWADEGAMLSALPEISYVQIFENRGAMGASNPHPHGQIWATESVPDVPRREHEALAAYAGASGSCLLCDYLEAELRAGERIVCAQAGFVAVVPFWAVWPFEIMVLPRRHTGAIDAFTAEERDGLAAMLKDVTGRYDRLFASECPYSMGIHQRPCDGRPWDEWHAHVHFYPPVLRSATVHKFMVGFELLGSPQRDLTAEGAAGRLREVTE